MPAVAGSKKDLDGLKTTVASPNTTSWRSH